MSPSSPLKFRTAGFPQYGLKSRPFRASLPVSRLDAPSPTLGYVVLFLPSPWASARLITGSPSPSRIGRHDPRVLRSARVLMSTSIIATTTRSAGLPRPADFTGLAYTAGPVATDRPSFHCRTFRACRPPYAGGPVRVSRCRPGRCQASPCPKRVAAHNAASASDTRRCLFTTLQGSLHAAARALASHPGLASGYFVERAFRATRRRMALRSKLDGRTGNLPSPGLSPGRSRQLSWLH